VAITAKIAGVIVAPGARGLVGEATVDFVDTTSGAFAYTLTALLVALVCAASFELARARDVNAGARVSVVGISGLIVALASPAVVERLSTLPTLALAVMTSVISLIAGLVVVRRPQTRLVGAVLTLLAICGLLRVVAWETSAVAFEQSSLSTHELARGFATAAVALQAVGALLAAAWISTRSRWRGRVLANVAILAAFGLTWIAARNTPSPSTIEAVLRASLPAAVGVPAPYLLEAIGAFLVPASILLAGATLLQPGQRPVILAAITLALLSHGAFDVPLQALLMTASAQWAILAMTDEGSKRSSSRGPDATSTGAIPPRTESA
jgi:hypothetical protein